MKNVNLVSTVTSVLFVANSTLDQLLLIKSPLETSTFTFQVSRKHSFKLHKKLKGLLCFFVSLLRHTKTKNTFW